MEKELSLQELKQKLGELEASHAEKILENEALYKTNRTIGQELERLISEINKSRFDLHKKAIEIEAIKAAQKESEKINRTLISISNAVNTAFNLDELYQTIHKSLNQIIDLTNFIIAIYDPERNAYSVPYYIDEMDETPPLNMSNRIDIDSSALTGRVLREGRALLIKKEEIFKNVQEQKKKIFGTSPAVWLGVPLKIQNKIIGVMITQSYTGPNRYNERDVEILSSVSEQVALAIERKRIDEALKQSEEKYRMIIEGIEDGYYEVDLKGNITFFNDSMCKTLGYEEKELLGLNNQKFMDEQNSKKIFSIFNNIFQTGQPMKGFDFEVLTKDGKQRYINASATLVKDENNRPIGFRGIARDITEHEISEKEKKMLETQLQRAQKMEAIGMLAGGVAHDLNNILAGLVSYPELLLLDLPENSPLRRPIQTIQKSGEKAAAIVQDLLTLARRGVAPAEVVNINDVISEYLRSPVFGLLQNYHPKVKMELNLEKDLFNILGSPVHLTQTIMNLVSNAAEAMPDGGLIQIHTANQYVDKPIRRYDQVEEGDYVTVRITDNGIGISPHDIDRIFEPFYTKKIMGRSGTGLGMAVVWGTVKDHHGYIDVQSILGQGTTFTLYFPITRQDVLSRDKQIPKQEYMGRGESILVIDDIKEQREIANIMLTRLGYNVATVASGEEAIVFLQSHKIDLIVLDMVMDPGLDGLETYQKIIQIRPGQKAIIVSGFSESERVKKVQELGAGSYLKKPFLLQKIGLAIRAELAR